MSARLSTPLTTLLGCACPIIQTAMGWVSTSALVSASIEAGAFGFLAAAVMTPEECEAQINTIRRASNKPFGVNIHAFQKDVDRIIDICIDYKVTALSYGRGPSAKIIDKVKAAGLKCIPTIGAGRHAKKAVALGADALVCQGHEGGGHTGDTPTWLLLGEVLDLDPGVPVIACGGFRDGRGLAAALAFGADGVAMGTRFMMSAESPTPEITKNSYIEANVTNIPVSSKLDGLPQRMIRNKTLNILEKSSEIGLFIQGVRNGLKYKEQTSMNFTEMMRTAWQMAARTELSFAQTLMAGNAPVIIQKAMVEGKPDEGILPSGQVAGLITDLPSCADIINTMISDAGEQFMSLQTFKGGIDAH